jgi:mRNA interferase RelE/StbE
VAYLVKFKPSADRQLRKIPPDQLRRIAAKIDSLAGDPRPPGVEVLEARERLFRVSTGDFGIIYQIQDSVLLVVVVKIGNRREVYRKLGKLRGPGK